PDDVPQIFTVDRLNTPKPSKVICIGRNYVAHIHELQNEVPESPVVFLKPPSAIVPTGGEIVIPPASSDVHHEVELVVEIGSECKNVSESEAMAAVRAYAVGLDMTARDIQSVAKKKGLPWSVAKGFDTFAPLGPLVAADGIDPGNLEIRLEINGAVRQQGSTSLMIFPLPSLISYVSTVFTLLPGDLIYTGTPAGVGPVAPGDRLVGTITGLPPLEVSVIRS
ncbi:MAG: fumarylacetoacetate hydrolase family protein, partial [Rhodothermales bacterium]